MTQTPMQMKVPVLIQMMKPVLIQMMKWVPLIIMKELKILKGVPEKKGLQEIVLVPLNRTLTPKQSSHLSLFATSAATKTMLCSGNGSSTPQLGMAEYYQSRAS
jgi:hypothetical protein